MRLSAKKNYRDSTCAQSGVAVVEDALDGAERGQHRRGLVGNVHGFVVRAGGHFLECVYIFHGEHIGRGVGFSLADSLGDAHNSLGLGAGVEYYCLGLTLGTKDFGLLHGLGGVDSRLLLALRLEDKTLLFTLGVEDFGAAVTLGLHLFFHGHAH